MDEEKHLVQDDTSEQWMIDHPEEFAELEKRFQEMHKKEKNA